MEDLLKDSFPKCGSGTVPFIEGNNIDENWKFLACGKLRAVEDCGDDYKYHEGNGYMGCYRETYGDYDFSKCDNMYRDVIEMLVDDSGQETNKRVREDDLCTQNKAAKEDLAKMLIDAAEEFKKKRDREDEEDPSTKRTKAYCPLDTQELRDKIIKDIIQRDRPSSLQNAIAQSQPNSTQTCTQNFNQGTNDTEDPQPNTNQTDETMNCSEESGCYYGEENGCDNVYEETGETFDGGIAEDEAQSEPTLEELTGGEEDCDVCTQAALNALKQGDCPCNDDAYEPGKAGYDHSIGRWRDATGKFVATPQTTTTQNTQTNTDTNQSNFTTQKNTVNNKGCTATLTLSFN